jgi:hypothetical protein
MKIDVALTLGFEADNGLKVGLSIPAGEMSAQNPLKFTAISTGKEGAFGGKVMEVAVGDAKHIYVAVAPPKFLLDKAGVGDTVQALEVKVQEGKYENEVFV